MNAQVLGQVGRLGKPLVAPFKPTLEWLLACVDSLVDSECSRDGELASTSWLRALERLLTRVGAHVLRHDVGLREPLGALGALERLVARVGLDVSHGLLALAKATSPAITSNPVANILALARLNMDLAQMVRQGRKAWERLAAPAPVAGVDVILDRRSRVCGGRRRERERIKVLLLHRAHVVQRH